MKSNLAGLYIQIEAKKRRINIINLWKVPKRDRQPPPPMPSLSPCHPEARELCGPKDLCTCAAPTSRRVHRFFASLRMTIQSRRALIQSHLCSKSTGAVTSCTRKYFASAGYFRATASYIAYATLRYETC